MPNFTALDMSLPEVATLVAAMVQAREAVTVGRGRTRKSQSRMHGGPTCLRTLALESESGKPI